MSDKDEAFLPWGETERQIYVYHDGRKKRAVDPLATLRKLQATPGLNLEADMTLAAAADAVGSDGEFAVEAEKAMQRLTDATRITFNIPSLSMADDDKPIGLTEAELLALLTDFGRFIGRLESRNSPFAQYAACCGIGGVESLKYSTWLGIYLNRHLISRQRSVEIANGIAMAFSSGGSGNHDD